jgi:hypothetical protein
VEIITMEEAKLTKLKKLEGNKGKQKGLHFKQAP